MKRIKITVANTFLTAMMVAIAVILTMFVAAAAESAFFALIFLLEVFALIVFGVLAGIGIDELDDEPDEYELSVRTMPKFVSVEYCDEYNSYRLYPTNKHEPPRMECETFICTVPFIPDRSIMKEMAYEMYCKEVGRETEI